MSAFLAFLNKQSRIILLSFIGIAFVLAYETSNHTALFSASYLPLFSFENAVPFAAWTTLFYVSSFLQPAVALWSQAKNKLGVLVFTIFVLIGINGIIFFLFPTAYPRPTFTNELQGFWGWLYSATIAIDTPRNCFPSQHVGMALFLTFVFLKERFKVGIVFLVWSILVMVSTLTTKQHYALDLVGGAVEAGLFYWLYVRLQARYNTP